MDEQEIERLKAEGFEKVEYTYKDGKRIKVLIQDELIEWKSMKDADKVIKELEALYDAMHKNQCYACSHEFVEVAKNFGTEIIANAIEMLKEQRMDIEALKKSYNELAEKGQLIVRCKDCKRNVSTPHNPMCGIDCNRSGGTDWFCADGERKE